LKCGVAVVDLRGGRFVELLEFQSAVEEIFDVQVLGGLRFPEVMGFQKDDVRHAFVVPQEDRPPGGGGAGDGRPDRFVGFRGSHSGVVVQ
jgi:protein O-GlcNAc transferase